MTGGTVAKPIAAVKVPAQRVADLCQQWKIVELALFGSVLRDDFRADSDVDLLVSFSEGTHWSLFDMVRMEDQLKAILGRNVDLVERKAVELSENYIRRRHILETAEPIYVTR
jgi:uncharacterized protein